MSIIHRYIVTLFFKYFCMVLGLVVTVYLSIDFFGRINKFLAAGIPTWRTTAFFLYKTPFIISQIGPVAVLLGVLSVFGLMSKHNELVALKSGGVSLYYLIRPMAAIGVFMSAGMFVFSEVVVPFTVTEANRIEAATSRKKLVAAEGKDIWIRGDRSIIHIAYYNPSNQTISGVGVAVFTNGFKLSGRLNARKGEYREGRWVFYDCLVQEGLDAQPQNRYEAMYEGELARLDIHPGDLLQVARKSVELPFMELREYIHKVENQGYDAAKYRVDLFAKTAFPAICLIMTLFGSGIALRGAARDGMFASFAFGALTTFVYWICHSFCLSLGYGGVLPPFLAAWTANLVFFAAAGLAVYNLE